nr:hypothetical protein [Tanacetum cinerariifolium]
MHLRQLNEYDDEVIGQLEKELDLKEELAVSALPEGGPAVRQRRFLNVRKFHKLDFGFGLETHIDHSTIPLCIHICLVPAQWPRGPGREDHRQRIDSGTHAGQTGWSRKPRKLVLQSQLLRYGRWTWGLRTDYTAAPAAASAPARTSSSRRPPSRDTFRGLPKYWADSHSTPCPSWPPCGSHSPPARVCSGRIRSTLSPPKRPTRRPPSTARLPCHTPRTWAAKTT